MKRLLQRSPVLDPSLARSLEIIDRFDELIDESASLADLAAEAAAMSGLPVGVVDLASEEVVGHPRAEAARAPAALAAVHRLGVRGREVQATTLDGEPAIVASIELAHGRVGVAWLRGEPADDSAYLVAERLAAAAAVTVLRAPATTRSGGAIGTELLTTLLDEAEADRLGAEMRLAPGIARLVVLARPRSSSLISPAALAQVLHRKLAQPGTAIASVVVRGDAAVVCPDDARLEQWLGAAVAELDRLGVAVDIGIGSAGRLHQLRDSWLQALDALACCDLLESPVLRSSEAGALSLMRRLPADLILADCDVQRVRALTPGDRELLRSFLVTGSLRSTAARVHLHHTSVRYRLARISEAVHLDLADPIVQHRLFVACGLLATVEREPREWDDPDGMQRP